jgi:hypothetical protein
VVVGLASASSWATVSWNNDTGTSTVFSWAGGYEASGYFGLNPTVTANSLIFSSPDIDNFYAVNPGRPTITDTLHVDITVNPGQTITDIIINEIGTRTSTNRTTVQGTQTGLSFGAGSVFHIDLSNNMTALASGQNIHKSGVEIIFTPAPGGLAALAGATVLTLGGRRRKR